jgi:transposase
MKRFTREELLPLARAHPEVLVDMFLALQERLAQLEQRVKELEAQLARNSSNSAKPPSSDGLSKPSPKNLRAPSGRKPGGQPGHPGQTLQRVKNPDHIELHRLEDCPQCGGRGLGREPALDYASRQVLDLPERPLEVSEHRAEIKCCPHCGHTVRAAFPTGVSAPVQYGPRFQSLMVYLNQQQLLPYDRLAQLCADLFGQPLSVATLAAANERVYRQWEP